MNLEDVNKLLDKLEQLDFDEVDLEFDQARIHVKKRTNNISQHEITLDSDQKQTESDAFMVKSPMVGVAHLEASLKKGQIVHAGDVVAQIESMKLFNDVTTLYGGVINQIKVKDGESVEFDQPLLSIKKDK